MAFKLRTPYTLMKSSTSASKTFKFKIRLVWSFEMLSSKHFA